MDAQEKNKLIAIVDDDDLMRNALQGLLKAVGLPARAFASAEEFLQSGQQHQTACLIATGQANNLLCRFPSRRSRAEGTAR